MVGNKCPLYGNYGSDKIIKMNKKTEGVRFGFDRARIRQRANALAAFGEWERKHYARLLHLDPGQAIRIIGEIVALLPEESRQRPVDTGGVQRLHKILSKMPRFDE